MSVTPATGARADASDCADEPIRIPGSVQPHGVLLACDPDDHTVLVASANVAAHLGVRTEDAVGRRLDDLLGEGVLRLPAELDAFEPRRVTLPSDGGGRLADVSVHEAEGLVLVEVEPHVADLPASATRLRPALRALQRAATEGELTRVLAREVRALTGFDRVMVYRFDPEWNGEVVAEDLRDGLDPYLGLHYPATDIPAQARELYARQWLRSIPDARYVPVPLVPDVHPRTGRPLDLSGAVLRSVSPVHLEYLANMGVRASMSVSLIVHGQLWGLVACHHESGPHHPTAEVRGAAELVGRTASVLLQGLADAHRHVDDLAVAAASAEITRALAASPQRPLTALTADDRLLDLMDGVTGAVARVDGETVRLGEAPDRLLEVVTARLAGEDAVVTDALARTFPTAGLDDDVLRVASGVLAVRLGAGLPGDLLAFVRPEVLREVHWAGDPRGDHVHVTPDGRLHPRNSFARWVQQVRGTAHPWSAEEIAAARRLAQDVDDTLVRRRADAQRLTEALRRVVLTERVPTPEGYTVTQRFLPAGAGALGGDWYDVTELGEGRLVLTVGDVAGHGMGVAGITAQVRNALRAYLVDVGSAIGAVTRLAGLVAALVPGELATLTAVELDPASGRVSVVRAGHLPVLHVRADGAAFVEGAEGPALGIDLGPDSFTPTEVRLGPGESLVLYSDGVVEERGTALSRSLEALRARAADLGPDAQVLAEGLVPRTTASSDDVTLLVLQRT